MKSLQKRMKVLTELNNRKDHKVLVVTPAQYKKLTDEEKELNLIILDDITEDKQGLRQSAKTP